MRLVIRLAAEDTSTQDLVADVSPAGVPTFGELPSFSAAPTRRRGFPLAVLASLGLHLAGAVVILQTIQFTSAPEINVVKRLIAESRVEHLLLRVPPRQPLLLPKIRSVVSRAAASSEQKRGDLRRPPATETELSEMAKPQATAVLLQPNAPSPKRVAPPEIHSFTVWSGPSPRKTPAPIVAGSAEPVPVTIVAGLTVVPEIPAPGPTIRDVPTPTIPSDRAGLTLPASGATPLRSEALPAPPGSATAGEPAAVIAISSLPPIPDHVLDVPPGNYLIIGNDGAAKADSAPARPTAIGKPETARREVAKAEPATAKTSGEATRPETKNHSVATDSAKTAASQLENTRASSAANTPPADNSKVDRRQSDGTSPGVVQVPSNRTIQTSAGAVQLRGNSDGSVSLTYPRDGQFDIVVIQSGAPEAAGDLSELLSGKPVHTVYLQVGGVKEWVLQYCLPESSSDGAKQSGMVVSLGSPPPLRAPFVLEAQLPPGSAWRSKAHQVFRGVLGQNGRLEQIRAVKANASPGQLIESLGRWIFRPATSGKEAKLVEVLLIIPPEPAA